MVMSWLCGDTDQVVMPERQAKTSVMESRGRMEGPPSTAAGSIKIRDQSRPATTRPPATRPSTTRPATSKTDAAPEDDQDQDDGMPPDRIVNPAELENEIDTENMEIHQGPFTDAADAAFTGKVVYQPCRTVVYTPRGWDPKLAARSAALPDAELQLEFVYGYAGKANVSKNVFYNGDGQVVYYTAGLGVVYNREEHSQSFFNGHVDDISAICLCPAEIEVSGVTYPAKTLVATGQMTHVDEGSYVAVWDSSKPENAELARLEFGKTARGFSALAFSPNGEQLAILGQDDSNSLFVYDWRHGSAFEATGMKGAPPQVFGVEWNPYEDAGSLVTFGRRHIKVWTTADGASWSSKNMSFGSMLMQNIYSAQWLAPRANGQQYIVAGCDNGALYLVDVAAAKIIKSIPAHGPGPKFIEPSGSMAHTGVRGLLVCREGQTLLSGGADGVVLSWDVSDGTIKADRFTADLVQLTSPFEMANKRAPAVRALDYSAELDRIVVGTSNCDVVEIDSDHVDMLMDGHSGDIWAVAFHPEKPNVFMSVSDSGHLHLVDAAERKMIDVLALSWKPRAVAFSVAPIGHSYHIAVGGALGCIKILNEDGLDIIKEFKDSKQGISDIKYSPDNTLLAVATYDAWIDIYSVTRGYKRIARCTGHSATVRGIDWNDDSTFIMSNSNDYEMLYWDARTGAQIVNPRLFGGVHYSTYTCMLGFPVMGIWHPEADGTDVNSLNRSNDETLLVTGDDHGRVKLFNYPCVIDDAPSRVYHGHSSHVMATRFSCNDAFVCSGGGHDKSVFQYRVVR
ncbi:hypothetical protein FOA52_005269 [Chlamydomonas sp. UWO 241]|nr:hypothetical protein FOA52_005269 [Chlamydomonas sp. UWO 241]